MKQRKIIIKKALLAILTFTIILSSASFSFANEGVDGYQMQAERIANVIQNLDNTTNLGEK